VAEWDYRELNESLPLPSDECLARALRHRLAHDLAAQGMGTATARLTVGLRGAPESGAVVDTRGHARCWRRFRFASAHFLPRVPPKHPCGRLHGHGFEFVLFAPSTEAAALLEHGTAVQRMLDGVCLNDLPGLENPTSEWLCHWLWQRLSSRLPHLAQVAVRETATAGCRYDGARFRIWKEQRFESARREVVSHAGRRWIGHSYRLRLHLCAPLDAVLGWVVDYGEVKALFRPVYECLDHRDLSVLPEHDAPDCDTSHSDALAQWICDRGRAILPALDGIELHETSERGVLLRWGETAATAPDEAVYEL